MLILYGKRLPQGVIQISPSSQLTSSKNEQPKVISLILPKYFNYSNQFSNHIFSFFKEISDCADDMLGYTACMFGITNDTFGVTNDIFGVAVGKFGVANDTFAISHDTVAVSNDLSGISNDSFVVSNDTVAVSNDMFAVSNDMFAVSNGMLVRFSFIIALFLLLSKINYEFYFITAGQTEIAL